MTEKMHPYRSAPITSLQPRTPMLVGAGRVVDVDDVLDRLVEALRVGDGFLVTVSDLRCRSFRDPHGPGLGRFHLAAMSGGMGEHSLVPPPDPHRQQQTTTFYTTMTLEQIRNAFFVEATHGEQR